MSFVDLFEYTFVSGGVGVSSGILKNCSHVITVSSCRDRERRNSVYAGDIDHAGTTVCTAASSSQPQDSTAGVIPKPNSCCKSTNGANSTNEQKVYHMKLRVFQDYLSFWYNRSNECSKR